MDSMVAMLRMVETAALLLYHVLPHRLVRQWVLSFPYPLRFVLASRAYADTFNMRSRARKTVSCLCRNLNTIRITNRQEVQHR